MEGRASDPEMTPAAPKPAPRPGPPRPAPGPVRTVCAARCAAARVQRSAPVRPRRPRRHGLADQQRRRTRHRLLAGGRHRGRLRPLRPPLRRPEHRGRADGAPAGVGHRRCPQDQGGRRRSGRKPADGARARRRRRAGGPADAPSSSTPNPPPQPRRPGARSTAPPRPPARRRWPPRPRTWPPTRRSGRPRATGCARSSTSGGRSAGWTARPTTRCGSAIRRPGRPSTGAAGRISPSSTASGRAPGRPRRQLCERAEELADSTDWGPTAAAFRDLLTEWKAAGPRQQGRRRRAVAAVQGRPGHLLRGPQRRVAPSATPSSAPTPRPRRRCSRRPRSSTPPIWTPRAPRCARSATSGTAIGKVPRERSADLERRLRAVEKKVRDAPSHGVDPRSSGPRRPIPRARRAIRTAGREGRGGGPHQGCRGGRASAEQWRQWAEAAADALGKKG